MKVISEMRHVHLIIYLRFFSIVCVQFEFGK